MKPPKFISINANNFWVENYTEEDKDFFLSIGFEEHTYKGFSNCKTLEFIGSAMFGMWKDSEKAKINTAIFDHYSINKITVNPFKEN